MEGMTMNDKPESEADNIENYVKKCCRAWEQVCTEEKGKTMYHQIDEVGLSIAHGNEKARLEAEIKELRAKVEELTVQRDEAKVDADFARHREAQLEKEVRNGTDAFANIIHQLAVSEDSRIELEKRNVAMREALIECDRHLNGARLNQKISEALSTTPVKGWVRVGELEPLKEVLACFGAYFDEFHPMRKRALDALQQLDAIIEKEK
jgi:hypothetical protein